MLEAEAATGSANLDLTLYLSNGRTVAALSLARAESVFNLAGV
jgi:hypothetical protein